MTILKRAGIKEFHLIYIVQGEQGILFSNVRRLSASLKYFRLVLLQFLQ